MPGTKDGGIAARDTNYKKYGQDFYRYVGSLGGSACSPLKGFGTRRDLASSAGKVGGSRSKRDKVREQELREERKATWRAEEQWKTDMVNRLSKRFPSTLV